MIIVSTHYCVFIPVWEQWYDIIYDIIHISNTYFTLDIGGFAWLLCN